MTDKHYDAIVVGAGPGGATAAYDLARAGVCTLLIEKQKLPRYKTCGGGITYKAAQALPFDFSPVIERTLYKIGIDIGELRASYGWVFPKGDHLSVGVGGLPTLTEYGSRLKRYDNKHTAARVPGINHVIRSHGYILPCRTPGAPVQKGHALLV